MAEVAKCTKAAVLYLPPKLIGDDRGAACSRCMMFLKDAAQCSILDPPGVKGEKSVCGFYINGKPLSSKEHPPMRVMPKEWADYCDSCAPTHCESCKYYVNPGKPSSVCRKVEGTVEAKGCCNAWEVRAVAATTKDVRALQKERVAAKPARLFGRPKGGVRLAFRAYWKGVKRGK